MANLTTNEKQVLEKIFDMGGGYVLNFSDRTIKEFFRNDVRVNFYDEKYNYNTGSKANRMRGFWRTADNPLVGKSIIRLIEYIEHEIYLGNLDNNLHSENLIDKGKQIGKRLMGNKDPVSLLTKEEDIERKFKEMSLSTLGLSPTLSDILMQRIDEINKCLRVKASLAIIILCGSTLEGILLGIAEINIRKFNIAKASPKRNGKGKVLHEWKLSELIEVSKESGFITEDVKKFSHILRDFRNYIHPHQQATQNFNPNIETAKLCCQVLILAISQISREK